MDNFCDILWVEDEHIKEKYFSDEYSFRVTRKKYMLALLEDLESEEIFSRYTCAILDINLEKGFGYYDTLGDEEERSEEEELDAIREILEHNQIKIRPEHDLEKYDNQFKKNAGYYVYLYLVHRGMPPARICMLTANDGKNLNLTGAWKGNFESAGLQPPQTFDRSLVQFGATKNARADFDAWLKNILTPAFRLRSCIIAMRFYAEKLMKDKALKIYIQNLHRIPLRLSTTENATTENAAPEFVSALWQIFQIWDSHEDSARAYQMTLKTARNWFAHRCLEKISLLTAAFLFGIGMRGLLGEEIREKIDAASDDENIKGYKKWERELLDLIKNLDSLKPSATKKEIGILVMESCREFFTRVKSSQERYKIELTTEICTLIAQTIGQKKNNIAIYEEDLLRSFLHGIYTIGWREDRDNKVGKVYDNSKKPALGIVFDFNKEQSDDRKNSAEKKYLDSVKNTLTESVKLK